MNIPSDPDLQTRASFRLATDSSKHTNTSSRIVGRVFGILALLMVLGAGAAWADFPGDVPDRFKIQAGWVDAQFTTQGSLSLTNGPAGAFVDFEEVFDLPVYEKDWDIQGFYRFSEKGYIDFGYVDFERKGSHVLQQDLQWGEFTFQANAEVTAGFGTEFVYAAYRHAFLNLEQVHISGSAGFSYLNLNSSLAADGNVLDQDGNLISGSVERSSDVAFPVPLLGLQLDWKLTKRQAIIMFIRTLYIDVQDFAGGIKQSAIYYEWYPWRHFAIGGGLSSYSINLKRYDSGDYTARFEYDVQGLEFYLKLAY